MKTKDWIIIIAIIVTAAVILWLLLRKKEEPKKVTSEENKKTAQNNDSNTQPFCQTQSGNLDYNLVMKLVLGNYMKSKEVCALQSFLNVRFNAGLKQDGIFGPLTRNAMQKHLGLNEGSLADVIKAYSAKTGETNITLSFNTPGFVYNPNPSVNFQPYIVQL
jgi:hypothetical protein